MTANLTGAAGVSRRRANTRARLMDAAMTVFAAQGIQAASVEEICEAAGFTRGAFYSNFESRDELSLALVRRLIDRNVTAAQEAVAHIGDRDGDRNERIEAAVDVFSQLQARDRESLLLMMEVRLLATRNPEVAAAYRALKRETHAMFSETIAAALEQRHLRMVVPVPMIIEMLDAIYEEEAFRLLIDPAGAEATLGERTKTLLLALTTEPD